MASPGWEADHLYCRPERRADAFRLGVEGSLFRSLSQLAGGPVVNGWPPARESPKAMEPKPPVPVSSTRKHHRRTKSESQDFFFVPILFLLFSGPPPNSLCHFPRARTAHRVCTAASMATELKLPLISQHGAVTQAIGLTIVTIDYHRPLVGGREIFGKTVPYGKVWRAGANENTTITFSDDVSVEGKPLPAGTYGLHMIPDKEQWTIIFSKNSTSWGSFSYDEKEDALRVNVKPGAGEMFDVLTYTFDDVKVDSAAA